VYFDYILSMIVVAFEASVMNLVFNERTRHRTSWLNALATALATALVAALGTALHFLGSAVLGRLRE
jgi:hypothetical protein